MVVKMDIKNNEMLEKVIKDVKSIKSAIKNNN